MSTTGHPPRPGLLFYSGWELGYHNPEAERKAFAFAEAGWDTVYFAGIGIRNPRLSSLPKLTHRVSEKLRSLRAAAPPSSGAAAHVRSGSLAVVPPRQVAAVRRLNGQWVERQLSGMFDWRNTVAWIRWPTPELVDALPRLQPAGVVYECVDAYDHTPGITGPWVGLFHAAERRLVAQADAVVVPSGHLAERFAAMEATVKVVPHGVDLEAFPFVPPRSGPRTDAVIGFAGTLDYRIDLQLLRPLAVAHPEWRLRLVGPVQEGFDPDALGDLPNVSVEPPVPHDEVGRFLAGCDAAMMPYFDHPHYTAMTPLKVLEILAAGRPSVARWTPALAPFTEHVAIAGDGPGFVAAMERVLAEDNQALASARRAAAEPHAWRRRLDECVAIADAARTTASSRR